MNFQEILKYFVYAGMIFTVLAGIAAYLTLMERKVLAWIQQRMLEEREPNYTHRVLILGDPGRRSLNLTPRKNKARFDQAKNGTKNKATDS